MLELIKKYFDRFVYNSDKDIKHISIVAGWHEEYYIKTKNSIICIIIDYKDEDFYMYYSEDISKFESIPIQHIEMICYDKNKDFLKEHNKIFKSFRFRGLSMYEKADKLFKFYSLYFQQWL